MRSFKLFLIPIFICLISINSGFADNESCSTIINNLDSECLLNNNNNNLYCYLIVDGTDKSCEACSKPTGDGKQYNSTASQALNERQCWECEPGYQKDGDSACTICPYTHYSDTPDAENCIACEIQSVVQDGSPPSGSDSYIKSGEIVWESTVSGKISNADCGWKIKCPAGTRWVKNYTLQVEEDNGTMYYNFDNVCLQCDGGKYSPSEYNYPSGAFQNGASLGNQDCPQTCGTNARTNKFGTGCDCKDGYVYKDGTTDKIKEIGGKSCTTITYIVEFVNNDSGTGNTPNASCTIGSTCDLSASKFLRPKYKFIGWENNKNEIIDATYNTTTSVTAEIMDGVYSDYIDSDSVQPLTNIKLKAKWAECPNKDNVDVWVPGQECAINKCKSGFYISNGNCVACDADAGKYCNGQRVETCKAGYYCPGYAQGKPVCSLSLGTDVTDQGHCPCPYGATSQGGSSERKNCYFRGKRNDINAVLTQFCDGNGNSCFILPGGSNNDFQYHFPEN